MTVSPSLHVLTSPVLFRAIRAFAPRTPWSFLAFEAAHRGKPHRTPRSLPELAIQFDDFPALREFYALWSNPDYRSWNKLSFNHTVLRAAQYKQPEMLRFLLERDLEDDEFSWIMARAIGYRCLEILQVLYEFHPQESQAYTGVIDYLVHTHELAVIQFLVERGIGRWTSVAFDGTFLRGDVDIVRLLLKHRVAEPSIEAIDRAAYRGDIEMIRLLHSHNAPCSTNATDYAARRGHLEVVRFLHEHRSEGCTYRAIVGAAENGHLEIVRFLVEMRHEASTAQALYHAVEKDHDTVVRYLIENTMAGRLSEAKSRAILFNHESIASMIEKMIANGIKRVDVAQQGREEDLAGKERASKRSRRR
ncbi:hypothetical protein Poli38472_008638 [Pythium oligandrum]|uniref:Ankyrin n=1 Tax=Pythium oligandrum TaxID=41045 RepID=A0A8K1C3Y0_PYTOL|nr:hypothetical protein Poli38472_008638 [Pythium oligandrum]|eukprot:TMW55990.1 hypothetical protein Poli38472_008638 [Pythium oligandrum]